MPVVDLIIVGLTLAAAGWGYRHGVITKVLVLVGLGVGVLLGWWVVAPVLERVLPDPYGTVLAIPGSLLCGALSAAAFERVGLGLRRRLRGRETLDSLGGALLASAVGLLLISVVAALGGRVDPLSASVGDSAIVDGLSAVSPPRLSPEEGSDSDPAGPRRISVNVTRDPQVRAAKASVVKIEVESCGSGRTGSGWVAADGIVVTNAHVVAQSDAISLQLEGTGERRAAETIWYDTSNDIALVRSAGVSGALALPIETRAHPGSQLAMLGFPGGGPYTSKPARLGLSTTIGGAFEGDEGPHITRQGKSLIADARPGNSGGPVVDLKGQVVGVVFARANPEGPTGGPTESPAYAVAPAIVQRALRRAKGPVETGVCGEG